MAMVDQSRKDLNFDMIKIEGKVCGNLEENQLIEGIALEK